MPKTPSKTTNRTSQHRGPASPGRGGVAIAPPAYGIDFVDDRRGAQTLPGELQAGVESLSGLSMADVKVHYNSTRPAQLQALAYTQGNNIHIGPGQERHLPHEAWHVVQQKQGRVPVATQFQGLAGNDDARLEHEADVMGEKARAMSVASPGNAAGPVVQAARAEVIQRVVVPVRLTPSAINDGVHTDARNADIMSGNDEDGYTMSVDTSHYPHLTEEALAEYNEVATNPDTDKTTMSIAESTRDASEFKIKEFTEEESGVSATLILTPGRRSVALDARNPRGVGAMKGSLGAIQELIGGRPIDESDPRHVGTHPVKLGAAHQHIFKMPPAPLSAEEIAAIPGILRRKTVLGVKTETSASKRQKLNPPKYYWKGAQQAEATLTEFLREPEDAEEEDQELTE